MRPADWPVPCVFTRFRILAFNRVEQSAKQPLLQGLGDAWHRVLALQVCFVPRALERGTRADYNHIGQHAVTWRLIEARGAR